MRNSRARHPAILAPILLTFRYVFAASLTPMVEGHQKLLFPDGVLLVTRRNLAKGPDLFPEELQAMARAAPARRYEFALGRRCAREALAILGGPRVAIRVGRFRDPVWPFGYVALSVRDDVLLAAATWMEEPACP